MLHRLFHLRVRTRRRHTAAGTGLDEQVSPWYLKLRLGRNYQNNNSPLFSRVLDRVSSLAADCTVKPRSVRTAAAQKHSRSHIRNKTWFSRWKHYNWLPWPAIVAKNIFRRVSWNNNQLHLTLNYSVKSISSALSFIKLASGSGIRKSDWRRQFPIWANILNRCQISLRNIFFGNYF